MAAVTSEFPSKPISYTSTNTSAKTYYLKSVKKRVTTCFQQLRDKLQSSGSFRKSSSSCLNQIFVRSDFSACGERFRKIFKSARKTELPELWKVPLVAHELTSRQSSQQLQIVARLFSSTQISSKEITYNSNSNTSENNMTIIESNYISVREEYPDIDSEVRAILLSHAQNGITISSIKSE